MNIEYVLRTDIVKDEDNREFVVYGITAQSESGKEIDSIPDIFFDKKRAEKFVSMCNEEQVPLVHLQLVAESQLY